MKYSEYDTKIIAKSSDSLIDVSNQYSKLGIKESSQYQGLPELFYQTYGAGHFIGLLMMWRSILIIFLIRLFILSLLYFYIKAYSGSDSGWYWMPLMLFEFPITLLISNEIYMKDTILYL